LYYFCHVLFPLVWSWKRVNDRVGKNGSYIKIICKAMKRIIPVLLFSLFLSVLLLYSSVLLADAPPDPGGDPGGIGTPVGGGSPIGSGIFILLSLASLYGMKRLKSIRKKI
jgi:hypothetical protein